MANDNPTENMVEITLTDPDNFLKVKETLERMGIASYKTQTLYQSCHILHKKQKLYIVHFKEMFILDGKHTTTLAEEDLQRRNSVVSLLEQWGLIKVVDPMRITNQLPTDGRKIRNLKIVPFKEKNRWKLVAKYTIGKGEHNE